MKIFLAIAVSFVLGTVTGTVIFYAIQKYNSHSTAMAGTLLSGDRSISEGERAQYACLAITADQDYVPALINFAALLNSPLRSQEASKQLINRVTSIIMDGKKPPYDVMDISDRKNEVGRIISNLGNL